MTKIQPGILAPVPALARHLFFVATPDADAPAALRALGELGELADGEKTVVALGESLVRALGHEIAGLRTFPSYARASVDIPSTPMALWCWLRGADRGELMHRARRLAHALEPAFRLSRTIEAFQYDNGRDLTGYEDGTENPTDAAAIAAAVVDGQGEGLDGASFVAIQQWVHDFLKFESMSAVEQDHAIGRRKSDNQELEDAPPSAHVKRTAQESFSPEAFILRRSMPWAGENEAGLVFVAFGKSFDAFEAQLRRMVGMDDGVADALFKFSHPVSGGYFWCPPLRQGRLDLRAVGL